MKDHLEKLNITAHQIKVVCEAACEKLGIPIDYKLHCPAGNPDLANKSLGPSNMLWRDLEMFSRSIIRNAWGGGSDPSPFKIASAVSIAIVAKAPIPKFLPDSVAEGNDLPAISRFPYAPASIIALDYSLSLLHTAKVGDANKPLKEPLAISMHFYLDAIAALTFHARQLEEISDRQVKMAATKVPFSLLALIYESVTYKSNKEAENGDKVIFVRPEHTVQ